MTHCFAIWLGGGAIWLGDEALGLCKLEHCTLFTKIQVTYYLHRRQYYRGAAGSVLYRKGTGTHKRKDYLLEAEKCDFPASAGLRTAMLLPGLCCL